MAPAFSNADLMCANLVVVEDRRHETRPPVPWILGVDRVAEV